MDRSPEDIERSLALSRKEALLHSMQLVTLAAPVYFDANATPEAAITARRQLAWAFRAAATYKFNRDLTEFAATRGLKVS